MERLGKQNDIITAAYGLFFMLLMLNVFTVTKLPLQDMAFTTMAWTEFVAVFILGFYVHKRRGFSARTSVFTIGMILYAFVYALTFLAGEETLSSSDAFSDTLLVLLFILGMAQISWKEGEIHLFALLATALLFIFFLQWIHQGCPIFQYQSSIRNPNIFGALVAALLYFPFSSFSSSGMGQRLLFGMGILVGLFLIYVSSARAALLLVFIAVTTRLVLLFSKKLFRLLFYIVMVFNVIFVLVYGWLYKSQLLATMNDWFLQHFGKQIFSGRQDIWEPAIHYGMKTPLFGHFPGIVPKDYIADTSYVHAHNQYLQVFLESGFLGLIGLTFLLYAVWKTFQKRLDSELVVWSACFYLGILVYQSFEISLFGNIQAIGLFQWLIIAIGLGACQRAVERENS